MPNHQLNITHHQPQEQADARGPGLSLIFTHGYGGSASTWQKQVEAFAPNHALTTWDLLGHGASAKPTNASNYSRTQALADLTEVIAGAQRPCVLISHSLGGYLAQCRYLQNSTDIVGLVLIATGPGFRSEKGRESWNRNVQKAAQRFDVPNESAGMVEQHDALVIDNLERLDCPVLQIAGSRDKSFLPAMDLMATKVPDITTLIVPDAGHHVHESHAPQVNRAILEFLDRLLL